MAGEPSLMRFSPDTTLARRPVRQALADPSFLREGHNVWRRARAGRASVLVDACAYFSALRAAMLEAEHSIHILGWDIDSRTRLVGESGTAEDGFPQLLGDFLEALVERRPDLSIKILLWDYAVLYSLERQLLPGIVFGWQRPRQIELCLDDVLPFGASHHQKVVVIDDTLAFSGGLDLTIRRWDHPAHKPGDPCRVDPGDVPYRPFHDVQMMVDGEAARALARLVRERWRRAACEGLPTRLAQRDLWPMAVRPDFLDVEIGISRTLPSLGAEAPVREVEQLFIDMFEAAERSVYIENQFLTSLRLAAVLARRMVERPELEVLMVAPQTHHTWLEHQAMGVGRAQFMRIFTDLGLADRVHLAYPAVCDGGESADVMVHSKICIVDDRILRVGSANLCNRSMGTDTECDLVIEAADARTRAGIAAVRNRLLGEHCGLEPEAVAASLAKDPSILTLARTGQRECHWLEAVTLEAVDPDAANPIQSIADPEAPLSMPEFLAGENTAPQRDRWLPRAVVAIAGLLVFAGLILLWRYTALAEIANPTVLKAWLVQFDGIVLGAVVIAGFLLGGLVAFPVTVMIAATALALGSWQGLLYAGIGSVASALSTYFIGRLIGTQPLRDFMGPRINRISRSMARQGIVTMVAVRLLPVAPFTLVNLVAGSIRVPFADFLIGTLIGLAPGLITMSVLGGQVLDIFQDPSFTTLGIMLAVLVGGIGLSLLLQRLMASTRSAA